MNQPMRPAIHLKPHSDSQNPAQVFVSGGDRLVCSRTDQLFLESRFGSVAVTAFACSRRPLVGQLVCLLSVWAGATIGLASRGGADTGADVPAAHSATASLSRRIDRAVADFYRGPEIPRANEWDLHRRVSLDLIGRGPTIEEQNRHQQRLQQPGVDRDTAWRELVDELLARDEFTRQWARVLEVQFSERRPDDKISTQQFRAWLRNSLEQKRPLNEICLEILAADGTGETLRPAASFFLNRLAEPNLMVRDVGRIFFGRDVQCAQCHDHPLVSDYEQSEYFGILSFVNRTYLFTDEERGKWLFLGEKAEGELEFASVFYPARGKTTARPVLPMVMAMDAEPGPVDDADAYVIPPTKTQRGVPRYSRRQQLAVLATHPQNQPFNRNLANRLWSHLMGTGVVHPVDMHHAGNPPVSATLLQQLADELVAQGYDLRAFLREVVLSQTYQRSVAPPDLKSWGGPAGGVATLDAELAAFSQELAALEQPQASLADEFTRAQGDLDRAQAQVDRVQQQIREARDALQKQREMRDQLQAPLAEAQAGLRKQQALIASLKGALAEADKAIQLAPEDQDLAKTREALNTRLTAATEALGGLTNQMQERAEQLQVAQGQVNDLRSRIVALSNRRLALGEFVVEARGVQRRIHTRQQALADTQSDLVLKQQRWTELKAWLELRGEVQRREGAGDAAGLAEWQARQDQQDAQLVESWRRGFALRNIRWLSPEQLAGALVSSLGMDRPVRAKVLADWTAANPGKTADPTQEPTLREKLEFAVFDQVWTVEDETGERFGAPAGTPQDGFFATTDQALMMQNNPGFLGWLKPNEGTLTHRLQVLQDAGGVAEELYRSVFARPPDAEERVQVVRWLSPPSAAPDGSSPAADRAALVQELVWGLLTSTEFRFIP